MIKLVQGFDVCSPLPIDGRILLSKNEMYEIDDNILPEKYFAICKEDGRLYLYNKFNVVTEETGKWRLADNATDERITREVETLNNRIDGEVNTLNERIDDEVATLNTRISNEVEELVAVDEENFEILDSRITREVDTLNSTINTKEAALQTEDQRLDKKIDDYKEDKQLVSEPELIETLASYSLGDEAGTKIVLSMDTTDYILKIQLFNRDDEEISSSEVNTPIEEFVIDADYDEERQMIILHLKNGHDVEIPLGALISDLVDKETFDAHVNNTNLDHQHINAADRTRWNTTSREAVVRYDIDDPDNPNSLYNQLVAGSNVGVDTTGNNKVRISAKDTIIGITSSTGSISITSTPTPGAPDGITYDINTEAAAPHWDSIQGDDPLENGSLKTLVDGINANISNEEQARIAGDEGLTNDLSSLSESVDSRFTSTNNTLQDEINRSTAKDTELETALANEVTRATAKETSLEDSINSIVNEDIASLEAKDIELESALNAEVARATSKEDELNASIQGEVTSRTQADEALQENLGSAVNRIREIENKIPNDASSSNQLADKEFVNSSIATATANFIGTFNSLEELEQQEADDNDYGFVVVNSEGNTIYKRYKFNGTEWLFEYDLNNSSFTAEQWEAINSGANINLINQITTNKNNISNLSTTKLDKDSNKSLVDNTEIQKLATVAIGATKVTASTEPGRGDILVTTVESGIPETINVYRHPQGSAYSKQTGFYKFSTDYTSHVNSTSNVVAKDITDLNPYLFGSGLSTNTVNGVTSVNVSTIKQINLSAGSNWSEVESGFGYQQSQNISGILATSEPTIDIDLSSAESEEDVKNILNNWSYIYKATTANGSITFYATSIPTVALRVNVKGY